MGSAQRRFHSKVKGSITLTSMKPHLQLEGVIGSRAVFPAHFGKEGFLSLIQIITISGNVVSDSVLRGWRSTAVGSSVRSGLKLMTALEMPWLPSLKETVHWDARGLLGWKVRHKQARERRFLSGSNRNRGEPRMLSSPGAGSQHQGRQGELCLERRRLPQILIR